MAFENMDENTELEGNPPGEEPSNRTFLIAAGILGGIALMALICIALYALVILPRTREQRAQQAATVIAQNTEIAFISTRTAAAGFAPGAGGEDTPTPTATLPAATTTPTPTSVVAVPTNTQVSTPLDPRTATVSALQTQAAKITRTVVPTTTALPTTGLFDEMDMGLPSMVGLAFLLIVITFLARRLRTA